jgi:hypothetical protein
MVETTIGRPDFDQARMFLHLLDSQADRFTFQTFADAKNGSSNGHLARVLHTSGFSPELLNLHDNGAGVFVCANKTDGTGRKGEHITRVRTVWQEDDDCFEGEFPLEPSIVVETSEGRYHRYWLVEDDWPADEQGRADFASAMERMVTSSGSDPNAKDISRVLWVPGFFHQKGEPRMVRMVGGCGRRYTRAELMAAFPPVEKKTRAQNGHASASHLWRPTGEETERVRDALKAIPADDYDIYVKVCMALKSAFGDSGFGLCRE